MKTRFGIKNKLYIPVKTRHDTKLQYCIDAQLEANKDQLQKIQMIYQMADVAMNPKQTVYDIISRPASFFAGLSGASLRKRVIQLLEQIDLDESFIDRYPSELSGG